MPCQAAISTPNLGNLARSPSCIDMTALISYQTHMKTVSRLVCISILVVAVDWLWAADAPSTFKVGEFTFTRPAGWGLGEAASPMRKAGVEEAGGRP